MTLRELKIRLDGIPDKFLDADILVDTEGAEFLCHMVNVTGVYVESEDDTGIRDIVYLSLDDDTKNLSGKTLSSMIEENQTRLEEYIRMLNAE